MPEKHKIVRRRRLPTDIHDRIFSIHEYQVDVATRQIYLAGEGGLLDLPEPGDIRTEPGVDFAMTTKLIRNLQLLNALSDQPILVHMQTCGGDWSEGLAIYDALRFSRAPIVILSYTHARSMSSIILQAADRRVLMPCSYMLFHRGSACYQGTHRAAISQALFYERHYEQMLDIYEAAVRRGGMMAGWSSRRIRERFNHMMDQKTDVFLKAEDAVEMGLADYVFDGDWVGLTKGLKTRE